MRISNLSLETFHTYIIIYYLFMYDFYCLEFYFVSVKITFTFSFYVKRFELRKETTLCKN